MTNGVFEKPSVDESTQSEGGVSVRFEVVLERIVIVYAPTLIEASERALQVDGVVGRYKVVECVAVGPSGMDSREPIIDRAPSRETQK